jgi:hypothetical protein
MEFNTRGILDGEPLPETITCINHVGPLVLLMAGSLLRIVTNGWSVSERDPYTSHHSRRYPSSTLNQTDENFNLKVSPAPSQDLDSRLHSGGVRNDNRLSE